MKLRDERDRLYAGVIVLAVFLAVACFAASGASFELQLEGMALTLITSAAVVAVLVHELLLWRLTLPQMMRTLPARSVDVAGLAHGIFPAALGLGLAFISPHWWLGLPFVLASLITVIFLWKRNSVA